MGFTKYSEDITERRVDDLARMYPTSYGPRLRSDVPRIEEVKASGAQVYLAASLLEEKTAFVISNPPKLRIRAYGDPVTLGARFAGPDSHDRWTDLKFGADGLFTPEPKSPGLCRLRIYTEGFQEDYSIDFVESAQLDIVPEVERALSDMIQGCETWDERMFIVFRHELESAIESRKLPRDYCSGLIEFLLGLRHQYLLEARYSKRLETAYTHLRRFRPYSPVADFICNYILYRMNNFDPVSASAHCGNLSIAAALFASSSRGALDSEIGIVKKVNVVITRFDGLMLEAVKLMDCDKHKEALQKLDAARRDLETAAPDPHAQTRYQILYARCCVALGKKQEAIECYTELSSSPDARIANEANKYLETLT